VGDDIPEELFAAVAQVLAFIFQLNEHKKGKAKRPTPIAKELPIPDEFRY
jgi:flagellar biosynthetic protein FlhB